MLRHDDNNNNDDDNKPITLSLVQLHGVMSIGNMATRGVQRLHSLHIYMLMGDG